MKAYRKIQQHVWLEALLLCVGLGVHLFYLFHTTFVDWPEMLLYPWFLTKGLVYYRDVILAYVPGAYYLLHGLYSLIGYSTASEKLIAYGFILLTDVLVYLTARRLTKQVWPGIIALFFFVLWQPIFSGNTIWYETILAPMYLIAYFFALRYLDKPTLNAVIPVGTMLAVATLMKQTAVWSVLAMCLFVWLSHTHKKEGVIHAVIIGLTTIAANLLVWGYFVFVGVGRDYGFWVFGFLLNLSQSTSMYALAPTRSDLTLIAPALIPLVMFAVLRPKKHVWLLLSLMVAVLLSGLPRWGLHRLQPMLAFIAVGVGVIVASFIATKKQYIVLLGIIVACIMVIGSWRSFRVFTVLRDPMQPTFFDARYQELLSYANAQASGPVYVLGNYDYLYFGRNERPAVLPWVPLFPWNAQVPGMEKRLIASLESARVPYILYIPFHPDRGYYLDYVPNELFLYVRSKYEKIGAMPMESGELYRRR